MPSTAGRNCFHSSFAFVAVVVTRKDLASVRNLEGLLKGYFIFLGSRRGVAVAAEQEGQCLSCVWLISTALGDIALWLRCLRRLIRRSV